jgi:carbon monoxide dehydrogenase subunit G
MRRVEPDLSTQGLFMAISTGGEIVVDVDRETAFAVVSDPVRLARCIPGCQDLRELEPNRYSAVLSSRVAFMTLSFKVTIDVTRIEPPHAIEAKVTGDAMGLAGHVVANASLQLAEADGRRTTVRYATDVGLTGKLGGLGQPVFRTTSAQMARQFGENLKTEIERGGTEQSA